MRILSVIRQVLDAEENVKIREYRVDTGSSKVVMDTMDEYGVEEALRLREKLGDVEIIALAIGPARVEESLRAALALGADRAILVETFETLDAMAVSRVVAQIAQREQVDLILTGGQQADWDSQALGAATAERLSWPQVTWTTRLLIEGRQLICTHDVDEGAETVTLSLPAVVTTQQGLNEPRYPTLPNIMKAKKKELARETLDSYGIRTQLKLVHAEVQIKERLRKTIDGKNPAVAAEELINLLKNEAKVLA